MVGCSKLIINLLTILNSAHISHDKAFIVKQSMLLRLKLTAIYMCMIVLGAFIMLLVMTFNAGIFFTVVVGQTVGYSIMPKPTPITHALIHSVV